MKKYFVIIGMLGILTVGLCACGNTEDDTSQKPQGSSNSMQEGISGSIPENDSVTDNSENDMEDELYADTVVNDHDYANGWTEEMEGIKTAITGVLGDNYWPDMAVMPDMLQSTFGLTADLYDDYLCEIPMISGNVDMILLVKAAEGHAEEVFEQLNAYREEKVKDTMQYPSNLGKIQASVVEKIEEYVCYLQLGADTLDAMDEGDEAVIKQCKEANEEVLEIIRQQISQSAKEE